MTDMSNMTQAITESQTMLLDTAKPWCWRCGRGVEDHPGIDWWGPWLIERAHIVHANAVKDRRAVVLLCSLCHRLHHGHNLAINYEPELDRPLGAAQMLGYKFQHDPEFYDWDYLNTLGVRQLPCPHFDLDITDIYNGRRLHRSWQR